MAKKKKRRGSGRAPSANYATESSFGHLVGQSTVFTSAESRFIVAAAILDFETDIANIKSEWIVPALMKMINEAVIARWNPTQIDNYADLVCYGAQLLAELKAQSVLTDYVPGITRNDASGGLPFTRSTWEGLLPSLREVRIPPMSYALVNLFDKVIQKVGAEADAGTLASYFYPFTMSKTHAEIETLLGTITSLYDAAVYATQSGQLLIPIDMGWLNKIDEVSYVSQFALTVSQYFPFIYDNGGAETETEEAFDGTTELYYSQVLGIPEYADAYAAFRGSSGAPYIYKVQSVANDKISFYVYADIDTTALTEMAKTATTMDWMYTVATGASRTQVGPYIRNGEGITMVYFTNVLPSAAAWDRRMANWLARHSRNPGIPEVSLPVLGDIIGTMKRGNPIAQPAVIRQTTASHVQAAERAGRTGARVAGSSQQAHGGVYTDVEW